MARMLQFVSFFSLLFLSSSFGETAEQGREAHIERFIQFSENKNVFGKKSSTNAEINDLKYSALPYDSLITPLKQFTPTKNESLLEKTMGSLGSSLWNRTTSSTPSGTPTFRDQLNSTSREEAQEVGQKAFQTIEGAAKGPGFEGDPKTMGNLTFFREAASQATRALWERTLAQLTQRKVFLSLGIELSDIHPTCEKAAVASGISPNSSKVLVCEAIIKEKWDSVSNVDIEDPYLRDLRNQLQTIAQAGIDKSELQSNWAYDESEFKTQHEGNTISEQLQAYGSSLDQSAIAMAKYQRDSSIEYSKSLDRLTNAGAQPSDGPPTPISPVDHHKIQPKEKSIVSINQPTDSMMYELGLGGVVGMREPLPQTYSELIQGLPTH